MVEWWSSAKKEGLSWGGDLGRKTEDPVGVPSKAAHVGPGRTPRENLQQKTNITKKKPTKTPEKPNIWNFTSRGKQSTLAVTCSKLQGCHWHLECPFSLVMSCSPISSAGEGQVDPLLPAAVPCLGAVKGPARATPSAQFRGWAILSTSHCPGLTLPKNWIVFAPGI